MAEHSLKLRSDYAGSCFILTTKHAKSIAIAPQLWEKLGASVLEYVMDTDQLGTFSGEIERKGTALECARRKCEWLLEQLGDKVEFALASEGSFGPHPFIPFLPCDQEILYFIDRRHGFHLHLSHLSEKTNYRTETVNSLEALQKLAQEAQFPSHALILRPNGRKTKAPIFKGVDTQSALEEAFKECIKNASKGKVFVETDMRAQFNPSRMGVISELADKLAKRLSTPCPKCSTPGWGKVRVEQGLECTLCGSETELVKSEIFGCVKCDHEETTGRADGLINADPGDCNYCNP
jgi:hypothetical protein